MTDHVAGPNAPASSPSHLAELHSEAWRDYHSPAGHLARATFATRYPARVDSQPEPSELDVAISVGQQLLGSDQVVSVREALRLLLRALGAEPVDEEEAARRFVDRHFPEVTAFLASERGADQ
ncbi:MULTISPECIES: hypothetical protein [unclassified Streptomyces]|uniref:hypothetical protein n=1 Tax=unclassified Streptomyces TaxID=2593676 RepID=UPI00381A9CBE